MSTNNTVNVGLSGATGTGKFVGNTSPSIITSLKDTNGNSWISQTVTASAVNNINVTNNSTGNSPIIAATGSDTNILFQLNGQGNSGVAIQRASTNTAVTAGNLGEVIKSIIASGSAVSLTNATSKTITSINVTAGNWVLLGNVGFTITGVPTFIAYGINTTTNTLPDLSVYGGQTTNSTNTGGAAPAQIISISATTTYYLIAQANFSTGTVTGCGGIIAIRL